MNNHLSPQLIVHKKKRTTPYGVGNPCPVFEQVQKVVALNQLMRSPTPLNTWISLSYVHVHLFIINFRMSATM